jgi:hypothetical protein
VRVLEESEIKKLPYAIPGFDSKGVGDWYCNWGRVHMDNDCLGLESEEEDSGALATLNGGHYWLDYVVIADISVERGNGYLIGRYMDGNNYVFCGIDRGGLVLRQKVGGEFQTIGFLELVAPQNEYSIGMSFTGDTVMCKVDDQLVLGPMPLDPCLDKGGIGFKAWNSDGPGARISAHKVAVFFHRKDETQGIEEDIRLRHSPFRQLESHFLYKGERPCRQAVVNKGKIG